MRRREFHIASNALAPIKMCSSGWPRITLWRMVKHCIGGAPAARDRFERGEAVGRHPRRASEIGQEIAWPGNR